MKTMAASNSHQQLILVRHCSPFLDWCQMIYFPWQIIPQLKHIPPRNSSYSSYCCTVPSFCYTSADTYTYVSFPQTLIILLTTLASPWLLSSESYTISTIWIVELAWVMAVLNQFLGLSPFSCPCCSVHKLHCNTVHAQSFQVRFWIFLQSLLPLCWRCHWTSDFYLEHIEYTFSTKVKGFDFSSSQPKVTSFSPSSLYF